MSFSLLHKLVAYLLGGLGLLGLTLGGEIEVAVLLLMALGYGASWFAEGDLLAWPWWARAWNGSVVVLLAVQVTRGLAAEPTLAMAIEFAAYLQVSRLFNRRTAADYQQIAVLAFLHLIAATVLSTSLGYAAIFIGFVIATPWMLALSHLRREIEGNYPSSVDGDPQAQTAIRRVLASKRVVGPGFLVGTALLAVPLFAMTLMIFVLVPRVGQGFLTFQRGNGQKVTGFGNQVELGGFGRIRDDPTVVLRLTPLDRKPPLEPHGAFRLRGTSFDRYDGRRWTRSPGAANSIPRSNAYGMHAPSGATFYPIKRLPRPEDVRYRVVLDHLDQQVVFLPTGTMAVQVPPRVENAGRRARVLFMAPGLDVRYQDADDLGLVYTAHVSSDRAEHGIAPMQTETFERYLQVPDGHERVAELARQVAGESGLTDAQRASRVQRYLRAGDFQYTLVQPDVGDGLPLDAFLFDAKRGHCEYFSSAMAVMLRTLGIATRNVTGFVGGRLNTYGGYYALRQGDAHSWVEVYIKGRGWTTYDPTPASRGEMGPGDGLWADVNALFDALRTRWMTSVVGYDLRTQASALRKIASWVAARKGSSSERDATDEFDTNWLKQLRPRPLFVVALVMVVLGFIAYRYRDRLRTGGASELSARVAEAIRVYRDLERAMSRRGVARSPSDTPFEHLDKLRSQGFPQVEEVAEVTRGYMVARYGEGTLSVEDLARLRQAVSRVSDNRPAP